MVCFQPTYRFRLASFSLSLQALLANVPVRTFVELSHSTQEMVAIAVPLLTTETIMVIMKNIMLITV